MIASLSADLIYETSNKAKHMMMMLLIIRTPVMLKKNRLMEVIMLIAIWTHCDNTVTILITTKTKTE